jgi:hypothetical protein
MAKVLPLPPLFEAKNAERHDFAPDAARVFGEATEWRRAHALKPAASAGKNVHLLLIDAQRDFCFPNGSLYVAGRSGRGALNDNRRTAEFIYRNLGALSHITTTMDTHFAYQIFFPSFWLGRDDQPLTPFREITTTDIDTGEARPNSATATAIGRRRRHWRGWGDAVVGPCALGSHTPAWSFSAG